MIIYKITNLINQKIYIGQTIKPLNVRWKNHIAHSKKGKYNLYNSIRKYGIDSFKIEQIDSASTRLELDIKENYYIKLYDTMNRDKGYNNVLVDLSDPNKEKRYFRKSKPAWNKGIKRALTPIIAINLETLEEVEFSSIHEVVKWSNLSRSAIQNVLSGRGFRTSNNYTYVEKEQTDTETREKIEKQIKAYTQYNEQYIVNKIDIDTGLVLKSYEYVGKVKEDGFDPCKVSTAANLYLKYKSTHKGFYWSFSLPRLGKSKMARREENLIALEKDDEIYWFANKMRAAEFLEVHHVNISSLLNGYTKSLKGYKNINKL